MINLNDLKIKHHIMRALIEAILSQRAYEREQGFRSDSAQVAAWQAIYEEMRALYGEV